MQSTTALPSCRLWSTALCIYSGSIVQLTMDAYFEQIVCTLQDAAVVLKDASCELKCRLVALKWLLPPIPTHICDLAAHSAPGSGPPPAVLEDLQKPFRSIAVQVSLSWVHLACAACQ